MMPLLLWTVIGIPISRQTSSSLFSDFIHQLPKCETTLPVFFSASKKFVLIKQDWWGAAYRALSHRLKSECWKYGKNKRFLGSCARAEKALSVPPLRPRRCALEARTAHSVTSEAEPTDMTVSSQKRKALTIGISWKHMHSLCLKLYFNLFGDLW